MFQVVQIDRNPAPIQRITQPPFSPRLLEYTHFCIKVCIKVSCGALPDSLALFHRSHTSTFGWYGR